MNTQFRLFITVLLLSILLSCEKTGTDITSKSEATARLGTPSPRLVTTTFYAFTPKNYISVYNATSSTVTITFYYNNSTSSSSGWVNAGTKTVGSRKDASYCRMGAKQIRAVVTYDANTGTPSSFPWQMYSCN